MIEYPTDLESSLQTLTTAALDPTEGHLTPEEVVLYHGGTAEPKTHARLEEHLVECRACFDLVCDLAAFEERTSQPPSSPLDLETAAFWRTLQGRLPGATASASDKASSRPLGSKIAAFWHTLKQGLVGALGPAPQRQGGASSALVQHRLAAGLAASLLVVVALSIWVALLVPQALPPTASLEVQSIVLQHAPPVQNPRGDESEFVEITTSNTLLTFPPPYGFPDDTQYTLKIFESQDEELVTIHDLKVDQEFQWLSVNLPSGSLPVGDYRFVFFAPQSKTLEEVGDVRVRVVP